MSIYTVYLQYSSEELDFDSPKVKLHVYDRYDGKFFTADLDEANEKMISMSLEYPEFDYVVEEVTLH